MCLYVLANACTQMMVYVQYAAANHLVVILVAHHTIVGAVTAGSKTVANCVVEGRQEYSVCLVIQEYLTRQTYMCN